jgi:hypothetical protein
MNSQESNFRIWTHDQAVCEEAIAQGRPVDVVATAYGQNDFVLHFLRDAGFWQAMVGMEADGLKRSNGKIPAVLNGVEVLRELAGIDRIQHCGKILHDTRLMLEAGFNIEQIARAIQRQRAVIDPETLGNHLARISVASAQAAFMDHVKLLRKHRWIRGGVYAADAHEIIVPYGRKYEDIGKVGQKYGFKLVIVINVTEGRERIVGYQLAPLQTSERTMLREILEQLDREVAPVNTWMKILILDRGYWGARYLMNLHRAFGLHVVTPPRDGELEVVKWIDTGLVDATWQERHEERSRLGKIAVKLAAVKDVPLYDEADKLHGHVQAVVAEEYDQEGKRLRDEKGQERPRFYYVTTLPTLTRPYDTRRLYLRRWVVENQGFRELSMQWKVDTPAGKKFNANHARLAFVFMLYNAERVLRMKHPGPWQEERKKLSDLGERGLMGGLALAAYTREGKLGLLSVQKYRDLVQLAERRRIAELLRRCLADGRDPRDVLGHLDE